MKKPWLIAALGLAAAVMFLLGGLVLGWWSHADGELHTVVGLRQARLCRDGACASVSLDRLGGARDLGWIRIGLGAYAAAWVAAVLCLAMAGTAAAGKAAPLLSRTALVAVVSAGVMGLLFVLRAPPYVPGSPGPGLVLYAAAALAGGVAVVLDLRRR